MAQILLSGVHETVKRPPRDRHFAGHGVDRNGLCVIWL